MRHRHAERAGQGERQFWLRPLAYGSPQWRWPAVAQELVGLTTLDAVAAALDLDGLDFIKADIEGWEMALLRGGERTLRRFRSISVMELLSQHLARADNRVEDAFGFLAGLGDTAFELKLDGESVPTAGPREANSGCSRAATRHPPSAKFPLL